MSDIRYITFDEQNIPTIQRVGYLNKNNIKVVEFKFKQGVDIVSMFRPVGYTTPVGDKLIIIAGGICIYPNGDIITNEIAIEDCILQYRPGPDTNRNRKYIYIGIPNYIINKIITDAEKNPGINVEIKDDVISENNYYWFSHHIETLRLGLKHVYISSKEGNKILDKNISLHDILPTEKNMSSFVVFSFHGMMVNRDNKNLDLVDGEYILRLNPKEIYLVGASDIKGPDNVLP
jgi:hypothetical protein